MRRLLLLFITALGIQGCNLNLMTSDPAQVLNRAATTPVPTGIYPNPWYLYYDSLATGDWLQGMAIWDAYWYVTVDFADGTQPVSGTKVMKVTFNNANPLNPSPTWAELVLIHVPGFQTFNTVAGRDISAGLFTKCKFSIRTSQNATVPCTVQGASAVNVAATPAWQQVTINLPVNQTAMKTFFEIDTPSVMPLDIYIDDLRYEK